MYFSVNGNLLEACVLGVLNGSDAYGYKLTQELKEKVDISESTLYPVLRRLQTQGYLDTYDKPFEGRNRRYYQITNKGICKHLENKAEWILFKNNMDSILNRGGDQNE